MTRYERGPEFWDITQDGPRLVIVAGTGKAGKQTVRKFITADHAQVQLDKLVAEKVADGYVHVTAPTEVVEEADVPRDPRDAALEAAINANPYDEDAYSVYADWLQRQGDPRGELIALQLAEENDPDNPKLAAATRKYLAAHRHALAGTIARYLEPPGTLIWRFGFIHRIELAQELDEELDPADVLADVLAHPSGRFVTEIRIRDDARDLARAVALLGKRRPPTLRALALIGRGTVDGLDALPAMPLTQLTVKAQATGDVDSELAPGCMHSLARAPATLEALEIRFGGLEDFADLAPLFRRTDLAALRRVRLRNCGFASLACRALADSPFAAQLATIELGMAELEAPSFALLGERARFPNLRVVGVARDRVSAKQVTALRDAGIKIEDVRADPDDEVDGYYDEVRE